MASDVAAPRIVLGVSGGIAAYKSCDLLRALTETGHHVDVVPTDSALNFVGTATFEALSGNPVHTGVFTDVPSVRHVRLGKSADLVVVAPATADLIARMAHGLASDLLTATLLTARCPVLIAPAMHTEMWEHPATRDNIATLRRRGVIICGPAIGRLTGKDAGAGRLAEPNEIAELARLLVHSPNALPQDLDGHQILITAGGTRESLDPVRFLTNRSSGKQGWAIARVAAARGAKVVVVAANVDLPDPAGSRVVRVESARQLDAEVRREATSSDVIVMAAAVSDFRPTTYSESKVKKTEGEPDQIALTKNPDILAGLADARSNGELPAALLLVGFAAETGDSAHGVLDYGRRKLTRKGCDLLVVNAVDNGKAFGTEDNAAVILGANGSSSSIGFGPKAVLAAAILDEISERLPPQ